MEPKRLYKLTLIVVITLFTIAQAEKRPAALGDPNSQQSKSSPQPPAVPPVAARHPSDEPKKPVQIAAAEANEANGPNAVKFPYVGEVTGTEINVRSGPGMNFYSCGKINAPTRVVVVDQKYSWVKILPPPGSFSWIFKQYVQADPNNPVVGVVNGDNVRVYAGSDELEPMRSDSVQISLATGQKVRIIGQPVGDYYKIAPPEGSTLWTSGQYVKYVRSADEIDVKVPPQNAADTNTTKPGIIMGQVEPKSRQLEQYYTLQKQVEDEKKKPLEQQDFTKIKPEVEKLIADTNSGDAGDYAKYLLKDIKRCEVAKEAQTAVEGQSTELQQQITKIEKEHQEKLQSIPNTSKYAIKGTLKQSLVYAGQPGVQRFLIVDNNDKPMCYAEPVGEAKNTNFAEYFEQKVGLIGSISPDSQSHLSLIRFEKIEKLEMAEPKPTTEPNEAPKAEPNEAPKAELNEAPKAEPNEAPKAEPNESPKAEPNEPNNPVTS